MRPHTLFMIVIIGLAALTSQLTAATRVMSLDAGDLPKRDVEPACEDGVIKDDGNAEVGYGWVPSVVEGIYVQPFHRREFPSRTLDSVCVCWMRSRPHDSVDFEVVIYTRDGDVPAMEPVYVIPARAEDLPMAPDGAFTEVDLSGHGVVLPYGTFYIGARWDPSVDQFTFICADQSETTEEVDAFFIDDRAEGWGSVLESTDPGFADHRAMLIRAVAGPVDTSPTIPTLSEVGIGVFVVILALLAVLILRRKPD